MSSTKLDEATQKQIDITNRQFAAAGGLDVHIEAAARNYFVDEEGVRHALFNLIALDLISLGYTPDDLCEDVRKACLANEAPRNRRRWVDPDD